MSPGSNPTEAQDAIAVPLCVDLDDTLIRSDILWESLMLLARRPLSFLPVLWALCLRGKAAFKEALAAAVSIDPAALPYREDVLRFASEQRALGRPVILATATHRRVAHDIAEHLGIFSRVFATEGGCNLSGTRKRDALEAAYGHHGYDYIGDSRKDLPLFASARGALLVDPSPALRQAAEGNGNVVHVFTEARSSLKLLAKALRLHQWVKNVLLAVPLLAAHELLDAEAWQGIVIAFFCFGVVASSTYLVNDLIDLQSDRKHAKKRHRPLASGHMGIPAGLLLAPALLMLGFSLSILCLPAEFVSYLALYVVFTLAYSFHLKRRLLIDVLALALLYTLRILAGGAAVGVLVSEWLLMFSLFLFLSLAFLKRAIELMGKEGSDKVAGRGYSPTDLDSVRIFGIASGLLAVMVFSLYINSPAVRELYRAPQLLWLLVPLMIYWIARIWFLAGRGEVHHDPVVFALFDWRSYGLGVAGLLIFALATAGIAAW